MRSVRVVLWLLALWLAIAGSAYSQTAALQFVPITPCRLLDTRQSQPLQGGQQVTIPVQGQACEGLTGALAYSFNVTVVPHGSLNYLTLWPAGETQPVVSTLNSYDGRIKAVAAIIPAGTDPHGSIDAYATDTTNLILDINGYFISGTSGTLAYYALPPCRLLDTRNGQYLHAQETYSYPIQGSPCNVPTTAEAYSLNFTALPRTGSLNFLTAWPTGQPMPGTSTLNAPTGAVTANAALVQGGTDGEISVYAYDDTNLLIDVNGYFAAPGQANQMALYTLTPCRVLDTRPQYFDGQYTVQVEHNNNGCVVPPVAGAYVINATVVPHPTLGYLTLWGMGQQPSVSTLNASDGAVTSNMAIVQATTSGTFMAYASNNTNLIIDLFNYFGASLDGDYAFAINGYQNGTPFVMAGSVVADGNGNITDGVLDLNTGSGSPLSGTSLTGTYTMGSNGVGTMSLNASSLGMMLNFHFTLSVPGQGQLIWDDADPSPRGSGVLAMQTPGDFYPPQPGSFAIGSLGADSSFNRYANAGQFHVINTGVVGSGSEDVNDDGTLASRGFTGFFQGVNTRDGRNLATFTFASGVNTYAYYTIRQGYIFIVGIDALAANDPLTLGTILVQPSSGFTNASLQGTTVDELTGLAPNDGSPAADVMLGFANWDGNGNGTFSLDENNGGTITQQQTSQGTYSVASNGRVTLSGFGGSPPILYLTNTNTAFVLGQTNSVAFGNLESQSASPPFNNLSILGTYLGGTINPAQSPVVDSVAYLLADGGGNMTGVAYTSGPSGPGSENLAASYQVSSTGRAVLTGNPAGFMYVVSASKVVLLPTGNTPALSVFSTGPTN